MMAIPITLGAVTISFNLTAVLALIAGILILAMPRLLNYIVAVYLIAVGILGMIH